MENSIIKNLYLNKNISTKDIAKRMNVSQSCIQRRLIKEGVLRSVGTDSRIYDINHSFFENIDTEHKAYWLGFMYADGNISKRDNKVILSSTDKIVLEMFNISTQSTYKIHTEKHNVYSSIIYKISISSAKLKNDLINKGCVPNKSLILTFPKFIHKDLIHHFIRGYFDGDGSICIYKKNRKNLYRMQTSFAGTKSFINSLVKILLKNKIVKGSSVTNRDSISILQFSTNDSMTLYKYLYNDASIFLERKKNKFKDGFKNRGIFNDYNMGS